MTVQSKWVITDKDGSHILRASTIKPRLDYTGERIDAILEVLVQKRFDLNKSNYELYRRYGCRSESSKSLANKVQYELEISYAIESLRQVRRCLDSIVGMGSVSSMLLPTVSIVRLVRSRLLLLLPSLDCPIGEISLLLSGVIVDAAHLAGASLDFERANTRSQSLLDEAKLIADSKIYNQFPNLEIP